MKLQGFWRKITDRVFLPHNNVRCTLECGHTQTVRVGVATNQENSDPFDDSFIALFCEGCPVAIAGQQGHPEKQPEGQTWDDNSDEPRDW